MKLDAQSHMRRLFHSPKGRRNFYSTYYRGEEKIDPISSIIDDGGSLISEPTHCKYIVADKVGKQFACAYDAPPPHDDKDPANCMDWWDNMYRRSSKGIPDETFANILCDTDAQEVADCIRKAEGGKSAGQTG